MSRRPLFRSLPPGLLRVAALAALAIGCLSLAVAVCLGCLYSGIGRWPTTPGQIVTSEVIKTIEETQARFSARVRFEYAVAGVKRIRLGVDLCSPRQPNALAAQAICDRYPVGKKVDVRYCPSYAGIAVLEPNVDWSDVWLQGGFGVLMICGCGYLLVLSMRDPRGYQLAAGPVESYSLAKASSAR
jgi:hypothetical protein